MEISKVMEEKGDGISYIRNKSDSYTIGTKKNTAMKSPNTWMKMLNHGKAVKHS